MDGFLSALLLPGCGDDFLFALGNVGLIAMAASAAASPARRLLGLREFPLERIGLDEEHVGARFGARVLGRGVDADEIAGHQLEILEGQRGGAVGLLFAGPLEQADGLFGAAVDRIMKAEIVQAEFILGLDRDGDFLDGARAIIAAGPGDLHFRRIGLARLDEEIVGEAHGLALIDGGDVVHSVLIHVDGALVEIAFAAREANLLVVVEHEHAVAQRAVHQDFEIGIGAFDGAQIAAMLIDDVL